MTDWQKVATIYRDNRPLGEAECRIIDANRDGMTKIIKLKNVIINRLCANRCFTRQHKKYIESGQTMQETVDNLLDVVRRRSVHDFKRLAVELHRDGQRLMARLLKQGGGMRCRFSVMEVFC